jgi:hypothetical protein
MTWAALSPRLEISCLSSRREFDAAMPIRITFGIVASGQ